MTAIFVSYRRSDAPGHAGRLYDRLVERFGEANVFKDLDSLEPGADFVEVIEGTVARCDALVAVIGREWLEASLGQTRRLDDPVDWVHLEIANALKREIRVVPVLVHGATMPSAADLPEELRALARRHAIQLSETAWTAQVKQLIDVLAQSHQRRSIARRHEVGDQRIERPGPTDDSDSEPTTGSPSALVVAALEQSRGKGSRNQGYRTVADLAKETELTVAEVQYVVDSHPSIFRSRIPDIHGKPIYKLRE